MHALGVPGTSPNAGMPTTEIELHGVIVYDCEAPEGYVVREWLEDDDDDLDPDETVIAQERIKVLIPEQHTISGRDKYWSVRQAGGWNRTQLVMKICQAYGRVGIPRRWGEELEISAAHYDERTHTVEPELTDPNDKNPPELIAPADF